MTTIDRTKAFLAKYAGQTIRFNKLSEDERYIFTLLKAYSYYCGVYQTKREAFIKAKEKADIDKSNGYVYQIKYSDFLTIPNRNPKANNMFCKGRKV